MRDTAIRNTHSSVVTINNETDAWDADGKVVVLDESKITTEINKLQKEYDDKDYSRKRKAKYDLLNQDEMRYDDVKNTTTTWVDAIDAIKSAHPKPS